PLPPALDSALSILSARLPLLGGGGTVSIRGDVPVGLGLGSSAALCVALAEAALRLGQSKENEEVTDRAPDRRLVWQLAHAAESAFHGRPSGIDTGLAALVHAPYTGRGGTPGGTPGGTVRLEPHPPDLPGVSAQACPPLHLVVGALPRSSNTASLVSSLSGRLVRDADAAPTMRFLGRLTDEAASALRRPDFAPALGCLANEAEAALESLGLVHEALRPLMNAGREAGALGGKMSGAGGGGAFYLVFEDADSAAAGAEAVGREALKRGISLPWPAHALRIGG
ncbi:MAG TPA: hypothetical protein VMC79_12005, partial [Rectinemataceae bacterium]|nr:hypothetical protein [Rectinemataceae bacterium]